MPTYDYKCEACGHKFEVMQGIKDDFLKTCPACNQDELKRLIGSGGAILFKGTGFFQTDYRKPIPEPRRDGQP